MFVNKTRLIYFRTVNWLFLCFTDRRSYLYLDDADSFDYQKGLYCRRRFNFRANSLTNFQVRGRAGLLFVWFWDCFVLVVIAVVVSSYLRKCCTGVRRGGGALTWQAFFGGFSIFFRFLIFGGACLACYATLLC